MRTHAKRLIVAAGLLVCVLFPAGAQAQQSAGFPQAFGGRAATLFPYVTLSRPVVLDQATLFLVFLAWNFPPHELPRSGESVPWAAGIGNLPMEPAEVAGIAMVTPLLSLPNLRVLGGPAVFFDQSRPGWPDQAATHRSDPAFGLMLEVRTP